jgi:chromosome partitioning protein
MIVVCGGIKGGSGKTTVATNLAVMRARHGADVLLIDADDQETSFDFTVLRNERTENQAGYTCIKLSGAALRTETLRLSQKYQDIVIDTGGRDTTSQRAALSIADVVLVPFVPRSFDVWTLEKVARVVGEVRAINSTLIAYAFLNRADPRGQDNEEAAAVIRDTQALTFLDTPLGNRKAFANAGAIGLCVSELLPNDHKAVAEITTLFERLFNVAVTLHAVQG